ncbi:spore coat U domain-containing protein [Dickeya fangzhongdai]|nr:spore coat U domain-containing protein [Dickeya fangzhongdai]
MKNTNTADKIAYQLYQDTNYSAIWLNSTLTYSVSSFPEKNTVAYRL